MRYVIRGLSFLPLAGLLASSGTFAIPVRTGTEEFTLNIDTNLQLRLEETWGGPPPTSTSGAAPSGHVNTDLFLRRASLSARGTAFKKFWFYIKVETGSFGKRGVISSTQAPSALQDVVLGYTPFEEFYLEGGFLKTALSRSALDSSWRNNSLEGVSDILFYPNARAQRQLGLQVRGLLFDRRLLIRGGFYEGARDMRTGAAFAPPYVNPNGWPLAAGMTRLNLIGYETGYTYPGMYLDGTSRMSFGIGGQYQSHSGSTVQADGTLSDFTALAADFYADIALPGNQEALFIVDGYHWDYGSGAAKTGYGAHSELGYRWGPIEPQANFYWFNSDTRVNSFLRLAGGLTYFIQGHHAKIMLEYQQTIQNGTLPNQPTYPPTPWLHQVLLQGQLAL
jgi:hypothetical protein